MAFRTARRSAENPNWGEPDPLMEVAARASKALPRLSRDLLAGGFGGDSRGLARDLFASFSATALATKGTEAEVMTWAIVRALALDLRAIGASEASLTLLSGIIALGSSLADPEMLAKLQRDEAGIRRELGRERPTAADAPESLRNKIKSSFALRKSSAVEPGPAPIGEMAGRPVASVPGRGVPRPSAHEREAPEAARDRIEPTGPSFKQETANLATADFGAGRAEPRLGPIGAGAIASPPTSMDAGSEAPPPAGAAENPSSAPTNSPTEGEHLDAPFAPEPPDNIAVVSKPAPDDAHAESIDSGWQIIETEFPDALDMESAGADGPMPEIAAPADAVPASEQLESDSSAPEEQTSPQAVPVDWSEDSASLQSTEGEAIGLSAATQPAEMGIEPAVTTQPSSFDSPEIPDAASAKTSPEGERILTDVARPQPQRDIELRTGRAIRWRKKKGRRLENRGESGRETLVESVPQDGHETSLSAAGREKAHEDAEGSGAPPALDVPEPWFTVDRPQTETISIEPDQRVSPPAKSAAVPHTSRRIFGYLWGTAITAGLILLYLSPPGSWNQVRNLLPEEAKVVLSQAPTAGTAGADATTGTVADSTEAIPPPGEGRALTIEQVRYCVFQGRRLVYLQNGLVGLRGDGLIQHYNDLVTDFNSRCHSFRYASNALETVKQEAETRQAELQSQAASILGSWQVSAARPLLDLTESGAAARVQMRLKDLGFYRGTVDGVWGSRSRRALASFKQLNGLGAEDNWDFGTQAALLGP